MQRDPVCGMLCDEATCQFKAETRGKTYFFCSEHCIQSFLTGPRIAYFSMEIGIRNDFHTYSGGLGVLAGDTIRSSADLKLPLVAVTLVSQKGYFRQEITADGRQIEHADEWPPSEFLTRVPTEVTVRISNRDVKVAVWLYDYQSPIGGIVPVLFLDTDVEGNNVEDREITSYLYGGDERYRLRQELVLGIGGVRMLEAAGFEVRRYHMNEGHSSFITLELLTQGLYPEQVREKCVFTTHTPVDAAFDKFSYDLVLEVMGSPIPLGVLKRFGGEDRLNMTLLALNLSKYINGVAESHRKFSNQIFPGYHISTITNGIHSYTWTCESFRKLYDRYILGWAHEPMLLARASMIPDDELWQAHMEAKAELVDFVKRQTGIELSPDILTLGFARRATAYKRASLILTDLERLRRISRRGMVQILFAGKAHPRDEAGKQLITEIHGKMAELGKSLKVVYLENYGMGMADKLVSGADVWLNTPLPPFEASGTSGMKAAHNGVLNFSVLDGWWIEGCVEGVTGWSIGPGPQDPVSDQERRMLELEDLYGKLEYIVVPTFYEMRDEWIEMMENTITMLASYFNSHRMMRHYASEAYL